MKKSSLKQENIINILFTVTVGGTALALLGAVILLVIAFSSLANGNQSFNWILELFSDFTEIMNVSIEDSPYIIEGASYPPLAIMILYPFALICKSVFAQYSGMPLTIVELNTKLLPTPQFWIALILFFLLCTACIVFLISKKYSLSGMQLFKIAATIITAAPFVYIVLRGNVTYFALIFTILFLLLKNSKKAWLRELSYVCLAIAGCLKLYPLFFGVFLLKDKKWFASFRVAAYFTLIFFSSFFLLKSDLSNLFEFTNNLGGFMSSEARLLGWNNLSISALLFKIMHLFSPTITPSSTLFTVVNIAILAIVFFCGTVAAVTTKNDFSRLLICACVVILIPSVSYFYVMVFTALPLLEYIKSCETLSVGRSKLYLFSFIFLYIAFLALTRFFLLHSLLIIALLAYEIIRVFKNETFNKKLSA